MQSLLIVYRLYDRIVELRWNSISFVAKMYDEIEMILLILMLHNRISKLILHAIIASPQSHICALVLTVACVNPPGDDSAKVICGRGYSWHHRSTEDTRGD